MTNCLPAPGTIGLTPVRGPAGAFIRFGQWIAENPFKRWFSRNTQPRYQHAFLYLGPMLIYPEGAVLEAEPGGSRIRSVTEYSEIYWCENIARKFREKLPAIAAYARTCTRIPYSFLDYLALDLHRVLHIKDPGLQRYIKSTGHEICSALDDMVYLHEGAEIFTDGRWEGDVMPMDLWLRDQELAPK